MWQIPEIRKEIVGTDENVENEFYKRSFNALIQRLARPAANIFIENPRSRVVRIRIMEEYQMELLILNKFIMDGKICDRGIFQFLANGKLGKFEAGNFEMKRSNIVIDVVDVYIDAPSSTSLENVDEENQDKSKTEENSEASTSNAIGIVQGQEKYRPMRAADSQFNKLKFGEEPEYMDLVQEEIESDIGEFLNCMKNSIFYGSGIQRYYSLELDKFKRRFIELQEKQRWSHYFEKYVKEPNSKVKIPAPSIADEINERRRMVNNIREINNLCKNIDIKNDENSSDEQREDSFD